ncbi:holo-ACP synthase [bacterium endosymbiont of Pedicinus badii]|uniref:holo-ACP synthase n=1 Tax=bacterium endosymbiont of Pedicinus badii TaxID=1719126 RepID=UPI0009BC6C40|nr:holo-ACP synthase [bacterium endosymbiont of Pedicinus badii]OQM34492.1 hypothetical protein AOQ89_01225 [bacterium endosymbiont of Pedicinus badii]
MTIIGIGIDILEIQRIKKILSKRKILFAKHILSNKELKKFLVSKEQARFLAKRFSIKEAAAKALGTGIREKITFNQFEIYNDRYGKPFLKFLKVAKKISSILLIKKIHISISDEKKYVSSIVIYEN